MSARGVSKVDKCDYRGTMCKAQCLQLVRWGYLLILEMVESEDIEKVEEKLSNLFLNDLTSLYFETLPDHFQCKHA